MTVECPGCQTRFPVDARKIPEGGIHARCSVCSEVFLVEVPSSDAEAPFAPGPELEPQVVDAGLPEAEVLEEETAAGPEELESAFEGGEVEAEEELEPAFETSEVEAEEELEPAFEAPEPVVDVPEPTFRAQEAEVEEEEEGEPVPEFSEEIETAFQEAETEIEAEEEPGPPFDTPDTFDAPEPTVHAPASTFEEAEAEEEESLSESSDEVETISQEAGAEAGNEPEPVFETPEPEEESEPAFEAPEPEEEPLPQFETFEGAAEEEPEPAFEADEPAFDASAPTLEAPEAEVEEEPEQEELPPPFELPPVAVEEPGPYSPPMESEAVEEEESPIHLTEMEMEAEERTFEVPGREEEEAGEAEEATFEMPGLEVEERTFGSGVPTFGDGEATFSMDSPAIDTPVEESDDELVPTFGDRAIDLPGFETQEMAPPEADTGESVEEEPAFGEPPAEAEEVEAGRDSAPAGPGMPETPVEAPPPPAEQAAVFEGETTPEAQPQGFESPEQEEEIAASFEVPEPSMPPPETPAPPSAEAPPTAAPEEKPLPTPHFGRRDPKEKAQRLARVLVSDIILYNPDRHQRALEQGSLKEEFDDEIQKSWNEYIDQVGDDIANSTNYFNEALNEILCKGQQLF